MYGEVWLSLFAVKSLTWRLTFLYLGHLLAFCKKNIPLEGQIDMKQINPDVLVSIPLLKTCSYFFLNVT